MPKFFHVDRTRTLSTGATIDLQKRSDLHPPELQTLVDDLFPKGMTAQGWRYLWNMNASAGNVMTELLVEFVRRAEFADRPSRFATVFAFGELDDAKAFRIRYPGEHGLQGTIFEVEASEVFRCNMDLLDLSVSGAAGIAMARQYWSGERGFGAELWEYLLTPPVVLGAVAE